MDDPLQQKCFSNFAIHYIQVCMYRYLRNIFLDSQELLKMQYLKITVLCGKQDLTADVPYTIPVYNNYNVAYSPLLGVYFVTFVLL